MFIPTPSLLGKPIIEEIYTSPFEPHPLASVTFTTGISNNNSRIDKVNLIIEECRDDLCFIDNQNISMNYSYNCCMDFFEAEIKLMHEDATQLKYHLEILSNGSWFEYDTNYVSLSVGTANNEENDIKNKAPGFEIIILLFSIAVLVRINKKKKRV